MAPRTRPIDRPVKPWTEEEDEAAPDDYSEVAEDIPTSEDESNISDQDEDEEQSVHSKSTCDFRTYAKINRKQEAHLSHWQRSVRV